MKRKAIAIIAVLCGVLCAATVLVYMRNVQAQAQAARSDALERYGGETVQVCVATRDIQPGEALNASNAAMRQWLVDMLPADAVTSFDEVEGSQAASRILAGEVVSLRRFEGESATVPIPAGLQAVRVELGSAPALGELLQAGALVDVYATGATTALIASHVLVAAIETGSYSGKCVTLAVDPQKVQEVIAASQQTGIYLALPSSSTGRSSTGPPAPHADAKESSSAPGPSSQDAQAQPAPSSQEAPAPSDVPSDAKGAPDTPSSSAGQDERNQS